MMQRAKLTFDRRAIFLGSAGLAACATLPSDNAQSTAPVLPLRAQLDALMTMAPRERVTALNQYRDSMSADDQMLFAALNAGARAEADLAAFAYGANGSPYSVSHRTGAYQRVVASIRTGQGAALVAELNAETDLIAVDAAHGVALPNAIRTRTLEAIAAAETQATEDLGVRTALARQRDALIATAPRANNAPGVWALPDGEVYAALTLQLALGDDVDPREAHQRFVGIARDLHTRADALLRAEGLAQGSVSERLRVLADNPRYLFEDSDTGRTQAVAYMNERLARMRTLLPRAFADAQNTPAEVRRMSAEDEARRAAGRRDGATYFVDFSAIRKRPRWTLPSVVYHELLPGHLLQAPLQTIAAPHRLQTRYASGYSEGWAIYAEILADEIGAYDDDPVGKIGYMQWLFFRVARVIVDTGIHAMRWSRNQAIREMYALQGDSIAFVSIEDDIDRIIVQPGSFAAQGLAAYNIFDLREEGRRDLGARFDLAQFHRTMLEHGPLAPPALAYVLQSEII